MEKLTWTVKFEWEYDLEQYVNETFNFIVENNLSLSDCDDRSAIDEVIRDMIEDDIAREDDYLYENFDGNQYDDIVYKVFEKVKNKYYQLSLDI